MFESCTVHQLGLAGDDIFSSPAIFILSRYHEAQVAGDTAVCRAASRHELG